MLSYHTLLEAVF